MVAMGGTNFSRRQCICALLKIGFELANKRRGIHDKFKTIFSEKEFFIMVPRHNELH